MFIIKNSCNYCDVPVNKYVCPSTDSDCNILTIQQPMLNIHRKSEKKTCQQTSCKGGTFVNFKLIEKVEISNHN